MPNEAPVTQLSYAKRVGMSLLALLIIYGNLAVTFNPEKLGLPGWRGLPRPFALQDAFLIPGMFSGYSAFNFDVFIEGQRTPTGRVSDRARFIALQVHEHFPLRGPITYVQVFAAHHWDMLGASAQRGVWAGYARQIKVRHNRMHPDAQITRLRLGIESFPQSVLGYRAAKTEHTYRFVWYADP